jgi:NAD+ kinase
MKQIALFYNREKKPAVRLLRKVQAWLIHHGVRVIIPSPGMHTRLTQEIDCAIALGGDGTMLKVARFIAPYGIPLLGVNLGSLGFLAEIDWPEVTGMLKHVLEGNYHIENRSMLEIRLAKKTKRKEQSGFIALNDCVIRCGGNARVIVLDVWIGAKHLARYLGDGLIIATPTGSTAYSLAANGPIVHPRLQVCIIAPICSHTLAQRPIIVPLDETIRVTVSHHDQRDPVVVSVDGQSTVKVRAGDSIMVKRAEQDLKLVTKPNKDFYSILRKKLRWGER